MNIISYCESLFWTISEIPSRQNQNWSGILPREGCINLARTPYFAKLFICGDLHLVKDGCASNGFMEEDLNLAKVAPNTHLELLLAKTKTRCNSKAQRNH